MVATSAMNTPTATDRRTVMGVFQDLDNATQALNALRDGGFTPEQVSVVARDARATKELAENTDMVSEDAGKGAVVGTVLGGLAGWLVGISALAIPGIGPIVGAGIIGTTLAGAGIGAAAGGLIGALVGMGIPEEDANFYAEGVKRGGVLVTVQTSDDRANDALNIMRSSNAVDVDTQRNTWSESGWSGRFDQATDPDENYTWSGRPRTY